MPHNCLECGQKFNSSYNLKRHMIVHTGEKPFACEKCDIRFSQKSNLMIHIKGPVFKKSMVHAMYYCNIYNGNILFVYSLTISLHTKL